jgi:RNA methyltransferase, TrmH family
VSTERELEPIFVTSGTNTAIRMMRSLSSRKGRQAERAFLVEGRRLTEEAVRFDPQHVRLLLVREDIPERWWVDLGVGVQKIRRVAAAVFDAASDLAHAQGIAAICDLPATRTAVDKLRSEAGLILILDRLRDPGNVGTALRSAAASGARTVLTTPGTADPYAPKVVRAGMGAHFRLKVMQLSPELTMVLQAAEHDIVFADPDATQLHHSYEWKRAAALVIGGETDPISPMLQSLVSRRVRIPMHGGMDSLNAGVAASVLLFEAQRQGAFD